MHEAEPCSILMEYREKDLRLQVYGKTDKPMPLVIFSSGL